MGDEGKAGSLGITVATAAIAVVVLSPLMGPCVARARSLPAFFFGETLRSAPAPVRAAPARRSHPPPTRVAPTTHARRTHHPRPVLVCAALHSALPGHYSDALGSRSPFLAGGGAVCVVVMMLLAACSPHIPPPEVHASDYADAAARS